MLTRLTTMPQGHRQMYAGISWVWHSKRSAQRAEVRCKWLSLLKQARCGLRCCPHCGLPCGITSQGTTRMYYVAVERSSCYLWITAAVWKRPTFIAPAQQCAFLHSEERGAPTRRCNSTRGTLTNAPPSHCVKGTSCFGGLVFRRAVLVEARATGSGRSSPDGNERGMYMERL